MKKISDTLSYNEDKLSKSDIQFLKTNLTKEDLEDFFNIAGTAATYEVVTKGIPGVFEGTHQYIRDIKVAELLQDKFPNMPYENAEGFKTWLEDRLSGSSSSQANAISRLQGDGAGEVDFVLEMQGKLKNLFTKTDFVRDANGHVASNVPGIDVQEVNRFGKTIVNDYQVKTLRSADSIKDTIKDFTANKDYNPNTTLVGPKELIAEAKAQGLPNPTIANGTIESNAKSAEALKEKIQAGAMSTEITTKEVLQKVAGGAVIGAAVSIGISGLFNYIAYKKGEISKEEMLIKIGKDGAKGAICGGALAGLTLFIPGGIIGLGIGIVVGTTLRRALDDAFGDGMFAEVLDLTHSVQANIKMLHEGSVYVAELVEADGELMDRSISLVDDLAEERMDAITNLQRIENTYHDGQFLTSKDSSSDILNSLEQKRKRLEDV